MNEAKVNAAILDFFEFSVVFLPKEDHELKRSFLLYLEQYYPEIFKRIEIKDDGLYTRIALNY